MFFKYAKKCIIRMAMVHTLVTLRCMFFDPSYNLKCERHVIFLFDFNFEYCNRNGPVSTVGNYD